jgi:KaiC/GvpD/RAD55 family RecA-like ATPase
VKPLLHAALHYASLGWHVFPVDPRGKRPIGGLVPHGKDNATTDAATIRSWWSRVPDANIGIACEPSGIVVLDVDIANGKRGSESLAAINEQLTPTLMAQTGSGGIHAIYSRPLGVPPSQRYGFRDGLDLIGRGYVVAAPSVHASGNAYAWTNQKPIAPLPAILIDFARAAPSPNASAPDPMAGELVERVAAGRAELVASGRTRMLEVLAGRGAEGCASGDVRVGKLAFEIGTLAPNIGADAAAEIMRATIAQIVGPAAHSQEKLHARACQSYEAGAGKAADEAAELAAFDVSAFNTRPAAPSTSLTAATQAPAARPRLGVLASEIVRRERPPIRRYTSGIPQLDRLIAGGISTRQLAVILAPPADGKSALAVSMARHLQGTVPVLYASTELESEELEARLAAPIIGCSWVEIVDGRAPRAHVTAALAGLRIVIVGCEVLPRGEAALEALDHEIAAMTPDYCAPPVVFVDYLQDLARGADASNVRGKIGDIASRLRAMAQARDCAIVAVSSVSRAYYGATKAQSMREAEDATVYLAAAKESGDVDYAAAVVIFLDVLPRDEGTDHRMVRIAIAKSRHGTTGIVGARFFGATGRWEPAPDALAVMSIDARTDRRAELRETSDETQLLVAIQKHPDIAWRDLRVLVGLKGERSLQRADHARARLLAGKTIEEVPVEFSDRLHRTQRRTVLRRRDEATSPTPVEHERPSAAAHPTLTGGRLITEDGT